MQSVIDDPTRASATGDQLSEAECAEYEARFIADPDAVASSKLRPGSRSGSSGCAVMAN